MEMESFPWHLGVFDAHCHPTDTMASIASIPNMKASTLTIMATRGEDQDLVAKVASKLTPSNSGADAKVIPCFGWHPWFAHQIQIDEEEDASSADDSARETKKIKHYRSVLVGSSSSSSSAAAAKTNLHEASVQNAAKADEDEDTKFFRTLPQPKCLTELLTETRTRLLNHPNALVGEIGLDKAFRLPVAWSDIERADRDPSITPGSREGRTLSPYRVSADHQKRLLKAQLQLAGELGRPVSVHSVQGHGAVMEVLQEVWKGYEKKVMTRKERKLKGLEDEYVSADDDDHEIRSDSGAGGKKSVDEGTGEKKMLPFPPRICMHSYSGPAEPLHQFLAPKNPSDVYFSFSSVINFKHGRYAELESAATPAHEKNVTHEERRTRKPEDAASTSKVIDVIRAVPADRILVESDLHCAGEEMDNFLEEAARWICELRGWTLEAGVKQLGENFRRFVYG